MCSFSGCAREFSLLPALEHKGFHLTSAAVLPVNGSGEMEQTDPNPGLKQQHRFSKQDSPGNEKSNLQGLSSIITAINNTDVLSKDQALCLHRDYKQAQERT
ncbi:hypothetical protein JEQ12_012757 [Ovis aries]|uniref:Uncharacterized protein n=1 Tax=Ovis aries TaxID=9940 RepID=A0A835ZTE4_SHEEP|nr:hypothetical protein JEQ12_012757 [Ovis aries]